MAARGCVFIAYVNDIRCPGVVATSSEHIGAWLAAGNRRHETACTMPCPTIIRGENRQAHASTKRVVVSGFLDDGRRIMHADLTIERVRLHAEHGDGTQ